MTTLFPYSARAHLLAKAIRAPYSMIVFNCVVLSRIRLHTIAAQSIQAHSRTLNSAT
jgi:hypothetical protein